MPPQISHHNRSKSAIPFGNRDRSQFEGHARQVSVLEAQFENTLLPMVMVVAKGNDGVVPREYYFQHQHAATIKHKLWGINIVSLDSKATQVIHVSSCREVVGKPDIFEVALLDYNNPKFNASEAIVLLTLQRIDLPAIDMSQFVLLAMHVDVQDKVLSGAFRREINKLEKICIESFCEQLLQADKLEIARQVLLDALAQGNNSVIHAYLFKGEIGGLFHDAIYRKESFLENAQHGLVVKKVRQMLYSLGGHKWRAEFKKYKKYIRELSHQQITSEMFENDQGKAIRKMLDEIAEKQLKVSKDKGRPPSTCGVELGIEHYQALIQLLLSDEGEDHDFALEIIDAFAYVIYKCGGIDVLDVSLQQMQELNELNYKSPISDLANEIAMRRLRKDFDYLEQTFRELYENFRREVSAKKKEDPALRQWTKEEIKERVAVRYQSLCRARNAELVGFLKECVISLLVEDIQKGAIDDKKIREVFECLELAGEFGENYFSIESGKIRILKALTAKANERKGRVSDHIFELLKSLALTLHPDEFLYGLPDGALDENKKFFMTLYDAWKVFEEGHIIQIRYRLLYRLYEISKLSHGLIGDINSSVDRPLNDDTLKSRLSFELQYSPKTFLRYIDVLVELKQDFNLLKMIFVLEPSLVKAHLPSYRDHYDYWQVTGGLIGPLPSESPQVEPPVGFASESTLFAKVEKSRRSSKYTESDFKRSSAIRLSIIAPALNVMPRVRSDSDLRRGSRDINVGNAEAAIANDAGKSQRGRVNLVAYSTLNGDEISPDGVLSAGIFSGKYVTPDTSRPFQAGFFPVEEVDEDVESDADLSSPKL